MTEPQIGDTWNVAGVEVTVVGMAPHEVQILWPSEEKTWEDKEWLTDLHEKVE